MRHLLRRRITLPTSSLHWSVSQIKTNKVLRMMIQQHKSFVAVHLKFINKRISKFRLGCAGHISGIARLDKRFYS